MFSAVSDETRLDHPPASSHFRTGSRDPPSRSRILVVSRSVLCDTNVSIGLRGGRTHPSSQCETGRSSADNDDIVGILSRNGRNGLNDWCGGVCADAQCRRKGGYMSNDADGGAGEGRSDCYS